MNDESAGVDGLVKTALLTLGVPVERLRYVGSAETYITFQYLAGRETAHADDENEAYEHFYAMDIFSKSDYTDLLKRAKRALKKIEAYGITVSAETYEKEVERYHIPLEFYLMEE